MKYILSLVGVVVICLSFTFLKAEKTDSNCFCVCVVSNSNSKDDEMIKFAVKDKISSYINKTAGKWTEDNIKNIAFITNHLLSVYHCGYFCDIEIKDEKMPKLNFVDGYYKDDVCKTIWVKLGDGFGEKSWQVFYE